MQAAGMTLVFRSVSPSRAAVYTINYQVNIHNLKNIWFELVR